MTICFQNINKTIPNDILMLLQITYIGSNSLEVNDTIVTNMYVVCAVDVVMVVGDRMRWTADCPRSAIKHTTACCYKDMNTHINIQMYSNIYTVII